MSITEFLDSVDIAHFSSPEEFWERLHGLPNKDSAVIARTIFEERQSGRVNPLHSSFFFESIENTQFFHHVVSPYLNVLLQELDAIQLPPGDILELGSGAGVVACFLAKKYPEKTVVGIDLLPDVVATAKKLAQLLGLSNVEFHQAEIAGLQLGKTFGCVLSVALREEMSSGRQGSFGYFSAIAELPHALTAKSSPLSQCVAQHLVAGGLYVSLERCHDVASIASWVGEMQSEGISPSLEHSKMLTFTGVLTGAEKMPLLLSSRIESHIDAESLLQWRMSGSNEMQSDELTVESRIYSQRAWRVVKATEFSIRDELGDAAVRVYLLECDREGLVYFTTNRGAREIIFETSFGGAQILSNKFEHLLGELTYNPSVVDVHSITSL
ncbi:MAG: class I SAM-dependent methyltransferase [bacterium]